MSVEDSSITLAELRDRVLVLQYDMERYGLIAPSLSRKDRLRAWLLSLRWRGIL